MAEARCQLFPRIQGRRHQSFPTAGAIPRPPLLLDGKQPRAFPGKEGNPAGAGFPAQRRACRITELAGIPWVRDFRQLDPRGLQKKMGRIPRVWGFRDSLQ